MQDLTDFKIFLASLIQPIVYDAVNAALATQQSSEIPQSSSTEEKPLNVEQAAEFLDISKQTVYQNIDKIPHSKRFGRLYFYPSKLRAYLDNGKGSVPA